MAVQNSLVFPSPDTGQVMGPSSVGRKNRDLQVVCGIVREDGKPRYNLHLYRHFFASWMIEQGFQPKRVQTLMGHASIQMTFDVYGHLFPSFEDDYAKFAAAELAIMSAA